MRAFAKPGEEHLHLRRRCVLRFVQNDGGARQRAPAHKGDGRNLDIAGGDAPLHIVRMHHIMQRVIKRPQKRIDFLFHVAGQKADALARLKRRARQNDAFHLSRQQQADRMGDRQIGLAGARRTDAEGQVVTGQRAQIGRLIGRSGADQALWRLDAGTERLHVGRRFG